MFFKLLLSEIDNLLKTCTWQRFNIIEGAK